MLHAREKCKACQQHIQCQNAKHTKQQMSQIGSVFSMSFSFWDKIEEGRGRDWKEKCMCREYGSGSSGKAAEKFISREAWEEGGGRHVHGVGWWGGVCVYKRAWHGGQA